MSRSLQVEQNLVIMHSSTDRSVGEHGMSEEWGAVDAGWLRGYPVRTDSSTLLGSWAVTWAIGSHSRVNTGEVEAAEERGRIHSDSARDTRTPPIHRSPGEQRNPLLLRQLPRESASASNFRKRPEGCAQMYGWGVWGSQPHAPFSGSFPDPHMSSRKFP